MATTLSQAYTHREHTWQELKAIAANRTIGLQWDDEGSTYLIWGYDVTELFFCRIWKGQVPTVLQSATGYTQEQNDIDKAEFDALKSSLNQKINGSEIIVPTFGDTKGLDNFWRGYLYSAQPGILNIFDEEITTEVYLAGGWYELIGPGNAATKGDYVEFSVIDKNDVLGLFGLYGLNPGDILELKKFVKEEFVNPSLIGRSEFMSIGTSRVYAGLFFRTAYFSTGASAVDFKTMTKYYE